MSTALSALPAPLDAGLGGVLLANMLEAWLASDPHFCTTVEVVDELQDCRTPPQQARLYLSAAVDAGASASPSGEHRAAICSPRDGAAIGLERSRDSHPGPGPRQNRHGDDQAGGLQDFGGGCLDGPGGCSVCFGSLTFGPLESRLAPTAGVVRPHSHAGHRRRWLLRSSRFQRQLIARAK